MNKKIIFLVMTSAIVLLMLQPFISQVGAEKTISYEQQMEQTIRRIGELRDRSKNTLQSDRKSIAVEINGNQITQERLDLNKAMSPGKSIGDIENFFIERYSLIEAAKDRGLTVKDEEVKEFIKITKETTYSDPQFLEYFKQFVDAMGYSSEPEYWSDEMIVKMYSELLLLEKLTESIYNDVLLKSDDAPSQNIHNLYNEEIERLIDEYSKQIKIIRHNKQ